jgi:hypothetical protein
MGTPQWTVSGVILLAEIEVYMVVRAERHGLVRGTMWQRRVLRSGWVELSHDSVVKDPLLVYATGAS